ncbi:hypothetical protein KR222_000232 [Zaprionus bogoriensis]|nr:hypothetical protein KR222_000232 [Zaprionus bogoriensis]
MATVQQVQQVQTVQEVNIQCECHHRRGLISLLLPWTWDRPCRRCERMMSRNVVVVPQPGAAGVTVTTGRRRASPVVVTTTTQPAPPPQTVTVTPAQTAAEWQAANQPPRYEAVVAQ